MPDGLLTIVGDRGLALWAGERQRNARGPSFAVAKATGLLALAIEGERVSWCADLLDRLREFT